MSNQLEYYLGDKNYLTSKIVENLNIWRDF